VPGWTLQVLDARWFHRGEAGAIVGALVHQLRLPAPSAVARPLWQADDRFKPILSLTSPKFPGYYPEPRPMPGSSMGADGRILGVMTAGPDTIINTARPNRPVSDRPQSREGYLAGAPYVPAMRRLRRRRIL